MKILQSTLNNHLKRWSCEDFRVEGNTELFGKVIKETGQTKGNGNALGGTQGV